METAWAAPAALLIVVAASCFSSVHPGVLAMVCAFIIGAFLPLADGRTIGLKGVLAGFPTDLFVTLVGVTLLFGQAQLNGTLGKVARAAVASCRGNTGLMPIAFFLLTGIISAIGAGSIASAALVAPPAMAVARRAGISAFLMSVVVGHAAVAGGLSPISPTGLISKKIMDAQGLTGQEWILFAHNAAANAAVALGAFLLFGGPALLRRRYDGGTEPEADTGLQPAHRLTLAVVAGLVVATVFFGINVGAAAFAGTLVLTLFGAADHEAALKQVPWSVILMVSGVTMLTSLMAKTGGDELFTSMLSSVSTSATVAPVVAFASGAISVYSSTSGVVLPAFLPLVPSLAEKIPGADATVIAASINIGGNLVDVSPLSTIGALCIASTAADEDRPKLFRQILLWGLSMAFFGAAYCGLCFAVLG